MPKPIRIPVVPLAAPVQLVLGLPVGIARPKRRRARRPSPWLPAAKAKAA